MKLPKNKIGPCLNTSVVNKKQKKILLGQLSSFGDCLYATTIARQIKTDFPGCHLTWAIGSMYSTILEENPYVDEVWEVPLASIEEVPIAWKNFKNEALRKKNEGDFDEIYLTQIAPDNLHNYDGTIRSSLFRSYPYPITIPIAPVLRLTTAEVENVRLFAEIQGLSDKSHVILFECSPKSGQSFVTLEFALKVAQELILRIPDLSIILSSNLSFQTPDKRIIDGSTLSFRENAELTKYCTLLIGCSSGISWLCSSDWAKPLPMIQLINPNAYWFASFIQDYKYWNFPVDSIIEMANCSVETLVDCIFTTISEGFCLARTKFNEHIPLQFNTFIALLFSFLQHFELSKAFRLFKSNFQRHGFHPQIIIWWFPQLIIYPFKKILKNRTDR
jgi:hypothetical protein